MHLTAQKAGLVLQRLAEEQSWLSVLKESWQDSEGRELFPVCKLIEDLILSHYVIETLIAILRC